MSESRIVRVLLALVVMGLVTPCQTFAAAAVQFISATPKNTTLADGSPLPMEGGAWMWHQEEGVQGFFETLPGSKHDGSGMMIRATGLDPEQNYEVFGLFRVDEIPAEGMSARRHGAVRFGLSLASLQAFDGHRPDDLVAREPWVITPGYETGKSFGYRVVMEHEEPIEGLKSLSTSSGNSRLVRARLGSTKTDRSGVLPVFFAMQTGTRSVCGSAVLGIALRPAAVEASPKHGRKPGTQLHLAIRAGDPVTMRRELEAGAEVNAFDEDGLTPLFYAAASGDAALVRALLAHGAKPERPNQSISPLAAASMIAEPDIVGLLLAAGAKVPLASPKSFGTRCLHPVVAAIRCGSLPVLKLLLAASPDFHLQKFMEDLQELEANNPKKRRFMLVHDAMVKMDWEMAAYLIDEGFPITRRTHDPREDKSLLMLVDAVQAGAMAMPVVEALLRRGVPTVDHTEQYSARDALVAATMRGNTDLVRRFLPAAKDVGPDYQNWLLNHALCSENEEIIGMIRSAFPGARVIRGQTEARNDALPSLASADERLFLPRTSPPPASAKNAEKGKHVLAVVAAPDAAAGDVLAAFASKNDAWKVVDRNEIDAALQENRFSKPWLAGEHNLSKLGDRLNADCMIVVSSTSAGHDSISHFEVVEVATGLEVHREHFKTSVFVDEKEIAGFLDRAAAALDAASRFERHRTITLLPFSTQGEFVNSLATSELLRAAMQYEVDSTPGLISLSRDQSARLMEEKALDGSGSVWGATHMLEGTVCAEEDSRIKVSLRLETYRDGVTTKSDAEAIGNATAIAETAASAWRTLLSHPSNPVPDADPRPHDPERALNEGRRLMREAEWLHSMNVDPGTYLPLIEAAIALGVPADESILLHLDGCFQRLKGALKLDIGYSMIDGTRTSALQGIDHTFRTPFQGYTHYQLGSIRMSDELAEKLPTARRLLHQTSWYLDKLGADALDGGTNIMHSYEAYKSNEIWFAIQALCHIRARIHPSQIRQDLITDFKTFAEELDSLTRRYFMLLRTVPDPDPYRYYLQGADFLLYRRNPALVEGLASMAETGASLNVLLHVSPYSMPDTTQNSDDRMFQWMESRQELARKMIHYIGDHPPDMLKVAKADLECFVAASDERTEAVKRLVEAFSQAKWSTAPTRELASQYLLSDVITNARTTSDWFGEYLGMCTLTHGSSLLPSLLFSSRQAPDLLVRFDTYHLAFHVINQREAWQQDGKSSDIDPFRKSISAYYPKELRRLERELTNHRPVNGPPPETSIYRDQPAIRSKKSSAALLSLIDGAGKSPSAARPPSGRMEGAPVHKTLQAVLLADLRIDGAPGTLKWPLVDNADPSRLWVFSFPSTSDGIPVRMGEHAANGVSRYDCREPWLLGIDCDDGAVATKVNLHEAIQKAYGIHIPDRTCEIWLIVMDQTRDRILTRVAWRGRMADIWNPINTEYGSVLIDKADGRVHPVPGNPRLHTYTVDLGMDFWGWPTGLVAIGDHFYYLSVSDPNKTLTREYSVFDLSPDLSVKPLTLNGRKPEKTPFDARDRTPIGIAPHNGRLMVIHPSTIAEYDPVEGEWSITAASPTRNPSSKDTHPVADAQFWKYLRSIHELRVGGESTGWIALGWQHTPGVLPFASRSKGIRNISINASIPEDFLNNTFALHQVYGTSKRIRTLFKDHPRYKKPDMVVLAQTETDLILGMTTGDPFEWAYPSCNNHHLPFLWKISKQEILSQLNHE